MWPDRRVIDLFGIEHPLILAPMIGVGTVSLAASVCAAGGSTNFFEGVMMQKRFKQWMLLAAFVPTFAMAQALQSQTPAPAASAAASGLSAPHHARHDDGAP